MRISEVEALPVSVPFIEPFEIAGGKAISGNHVIIRMTTRGGETGYGESAPMSSYSPQTQEDVLREISRLESILRGQDPTRIEAIHRDLADHKADCFAKAGLDTALHDLVARCLGVGIHTLLGGAVSDGVALSWAMGFKPPEAMAEEATRVAKMGFGTVKVKVGDSLQLDVERVSAVRNAVGNSIKVKVDANQGYDLKSAIQAAKEFEQLQVSVIEQPLPRGELAELRELRRRTTIPIMVDESLFDSGDAMRIISMEAADIFNIKMMKPGGIRPSLKLASLAEAAEMPCMLGSMPELGVGTLGGLQLVVASSIFTYGSELIGPWMFEDDLLRSRPELSDGRLILPSGPGLGLEVDDVKLERYATA